MPEVNPAMSKANPGENRGAWVDEVHCIGCTNCAHTAPETFAMEEDYGRARVFAQWGNNADEIEEAVEVCPVQCIHMVHRSQLPFLEFVTQVRYKDNRVDVGMMQSGLGGNPFDLMHESYVFYEEYSAKQDHINAKFSAVQNAVRKEAVKTILKSRGGWVGRFVAKALDDFVANVTEVARDHTPDSVGTRKRSHRGPGLTFTKVDEDRPIPQHLALVPIRTLDAEATLL